MENNKEVTEIEIFTEDQLMVLPNDAKESIIALEANLPQKELLVLTPLVIKLLKIKEYAKIKYIHLPPDPTKEQLQIQKDNVLLFENAKKDIAALKKQNGEAKSAIKGPIDLLGKQVLTIEKSINSIIVETLEALEKTFKPYLDAKAEKAKIALDKKNAAATEAINALSAENLAQSNMFKKSTLTTFLKYEMLAAIKLKVQNAIENYGLEALRLLYNELLLKTFEDFAGDKDLSILEAETEFKPIYDSFRSEINSMLDNIKLRSQLLETLKSNEKLSDKIEQQTEQLEIRNTILPPPQPVSLPVVPQGTPISNTDVYGAINNAVVYGSGANNQTVPVYVPKQSVNIHTDNFVDLIIAEISGCRDNISYIRKTYEEDTFAAKTVLDFQRIEKALQAVTLLDKVIAYVLSTKTNVPGPPPSPTF